MIEQRLFSPGLLDKLAEPDPESGTAVTGGYGYSGAAGMALDEFEASVLRDVQHLLNTRIHWPDHPLRTHLRQDTFVPNALDGDAPTMADFPHVLASVVNYGLPDLTGLTRFTTNSEELARLIREIIVTFEPRFNADSVQVSVLEGGTETGDRPARDWRPGLQRFLVEADMLALPQPEHLSFVLAADHVASKMRIIT